MSKVFKKNQGPKVDVKRNTFDLSYASHLTGNIGDLIPVMCQEVLPGDSFEIDPKFGLRFNPTVFPIQTKMHGIMHFWYVRNRNLMTKWQEYIGRTDDSVVMPYISVDDAHASNIFGTGKLGDYLGVPTTLTGDFSNKIALRLQTTLEATNSNLLNTRAGQVSELSRSFSGTPLSLVNGCSSLYLVNPGADYTQSTTIDIDYQNQLCFDHYYSGNGYKVKDHYVSTLAGANASVIGTQYRYGYFSNHQINVPLKYTANKNWTVLGNVNLGNSDLNTNKVYLVVALGYNISDSLYESNIASYFPTEVSYRASDGQVVMRQNSNFVDFINKYIGNRAVYVGLFFDYDNSSSNANIQSMPYVLPTDASFKKVGDYIIFDTEVIATRDATSELTVAFNPFVKHAGESTPKVKINALPFRAYEAVYNYAYRDETVDPFILNGKEVYNDFITTHEDGADTTDYHIFQKNWERDYYTSCQVSPQQGTAPLVGISANGTFTFDDGTNTYTATATIGDDGETITGISTYSPDMPKGSLRQMMDIITNGISINDLRNVNSLQRWLETNIRRGYKYVDQIYSHYGVNPAFKANDCPEFLGGIHAVGDINQINNMSSDGLGQYAGQLTMFGGTDNKIRKYFDEHGYIIGVMSVFPEPTYSQMLPKHFIKTETPLDFYFPEFGHIGMQPITYNEVAPLEVAASDASESTDTINDVFGYQRAWADYLANNDQVHGDFRTSMSEFVVSRVFHNKPELGHEFIAIDHNDVDDVFVSTDGSNKMLGELRFDIKAQRPIPMYGIPSIE